ncbi:hypothetical protein [Janthinobacterium lividum]|uniref:hypothetical protein n=1 Tax=Janthinobacterium lividum TaxID=29581 RepID=UPI000B1671D8|nr:hypothetical protein [Janthinobacterium lividum]
MFKEDGADIVFVVGTPGSKWSAIAHALMYANGVNRSDMRLQRSHEGESRALHFGNYFGPGMEYGRQFDNLGSMSKTELLDEFAGPYLAAGGTKLLKSHLFARHLPWLKHTFPAARFLLVHRPDHACLAWWEAAGGFSISYPDYSWYKSSANMANQIAADNADIAAFATQHQRQLTRRRSMKPILNELGLHYSHSEVQSVSELEFERQWGLGNQPVADVLAACHAMAGLARTCVI